jgi:hypothetical protein
MWLDHLPASVAFCDVETTGLGNHDRIVSFGGIGMISRDLANGRPDLASLYLVFDPGMGNHRNAERNTPRGQVEARLLSLRDTPEGQALPGGGVRVKRLGGGHCGDRSVAAMTIFYRRPCTCAPALPT